jgi:predicted ribosomally synthesized peptide with nif11-like leader
VIDALTGLLSAANPWLWSNSSMSEAQVKAFFDKARSDEALKQQLRTGDSNPVALAAAAGFQFGAADLARYQARRVLELSDEQLTCVSGGLVIGKKFDWPWLLDLLDD